MTPAVWLLAEQRQTRGVAADGTQGDHNSIGAGGDQPSGTRRIRLPDHCG
jgi:hypothetical protein